MNLNSRESRNSEVSEEHSLETDIFLTRSEHDVVHSVEKHSLNENKH